MPMTTFNECRQSTKSEAFWRLAPNSLLSLYNGDARLTLSQASFIMPMTTFNECRQSTKSGAFWGLAPNSLLIVQNGGIMHAIDEREAFGDISTAKKRPFDRCISICI